MIALSSVEDSRLWAARLVGVGSISALAVFTVNMPGGFMGEANVLTAFDLGYAAWSALAVFLGAWGWLSLSRWTKWFSIFFVCGNVAVFVPPLGGDPVICGAVLLWNLALLGLLISGPSSQRLVQQEAASALQGQLSNWLALNYRAVRHLLVVAIVLTISVAGYRVGSRLPAQTVCLIVDGIAFVFTAHYLILTYRTGSKLAVLAALPLLLAILNSGHPSTAISWVGVYNVLVLAMLLSRSVTVVDIVGHFFRQPGLLLATSFALIIAVGTVFLSFPAASARTAHVSPLDALFTATSASCVTGLIVLDTPVQFSHFGHTVILSLIQCGGLNIMVLSAFAALLLGRRLGLSGEKAFGAVLDLPLARSAQHIATFIVLATLTIEAVGASMLAASFVRHGRETGEAVWFGVFHAVSAFCNAGFALQSDSLSAFRQDPWFLFVMCLLITLGGLGFSVLGAGWAMIRGRRERGLSVQIKLVLWSSLFLVAIGTVWFGAIEWNRSLHGLAIHDKLMNALLQSVTCRTAGFNSVDMTLLHPASLLLMMLLMFVGAAPGSTGGGIKVTTGAVLIGAISAISRGQSRVVIFRRTVPLETVYRSAAIAVVAGLVAFGAVALILLTHQIDFKACLFEVLSALGTVGLSLGATKQLSPFGKLVIIAVMFIGRVGPLTLALMLGRASAGRLSYPDARIMVG
jgi:trk system potassium uptake protein TrkH